MTLYIDHNKTDMYNAVSYEGYHGNCNQILNASVVAASTTVHLFNNFTAHPLADPTLFNPEANHYCTSIMNNVAKNHESAETVVKKSACNN